jgi:hypothetical protein
MFWKYWPLLPCLVFAFKHVWVERRIPRSILQEQVEIYRHELCVFPCSFFSPIQVCVVVNPLQPNGYYMYHRI